MHKSTIYAAVVFSVLGAACSVALAQETDISIGYSAVVLGAEDKGAEGRMSGLGFGVSSNREDVTLRGGFFLASDLAGRNRADGLGNLLIGIGIDAQGPVIGFNAGIGAQWDTPVHGTITDTANQFVRADITLRF
jgi:opacity protein-like surface antigen